MNWIIIDLATAPIDDAATYIDGAIAAPSHYKDPAKIAEYIAEKTAERIASAALDLDLARMTGIAAQIGETPTITLCHDETEEKAALARLRAAFAADPHRMCQIITYGGFNFDLPMLMRRARYLGVKFPTLNLDKYRSPHLDLCELLSDRNPSRRRPLSFYVKRLGWTDLVKPLSGAEESRVPQTGDWAGLEASLRHDLTATYRLAHWLGVIAPTPDIPL